jgi:EAL domain-containing protein (putative c-di-GMP-specific phosphodiesterase class I)/CheY-like chemotaxis protein
MFSGHEDRDHDSGRRPAPTVTVADDEPHVVEYLCALLETEGFVVVGTATDADGAVQLAHRLEPDVALLDLRMPGGGLEAARLIGSLSPVTKIVIFSSAADESDLMPLLQAGIDGYVVKGSPPERLIEAIQAALEGDIQLAPKINRFAMAQLSSRLLAEEQVALRSLRLRQRVGAAISGATFTIDLQPIVDVHRDVAVAAEALARFDDRSHRSPSQWLADAEKVGLLVPLELALAGAALAQLQDLDERVSLAINLSPVTVLSGRLHEVLTGVPVVRVILEITERAPVDDYPALRTALSRWRDKGLRLAVDDAGGGYSSFTHILELAPELIKLDASLIREVHLHPHRQALARAVIGFAEEMGVQVVAEGVESEAELVELRRLGVHLAQGYHLGRPKGLDEQAELTGALDLRPPAAPLDLRGRVTSDHRD